MNLYNRISFNSKNFVFNDIAWDFKDGIRGYSKITTAEKCSVSKNLNKYVSFRSIF